MANIEVPLEVVEIPWILRALEVTLALMQDEARGQGHDPEYFGAIPLYKELIRKFQAANAG